MANRPFENSARKTIVGDFCCYCGELATTREHFPPLVAVHWGLILPACKECNAFAGTEWCFDFEMRISHIKQKIKYKYRRCLQTPDWEQDAISELGYGLKDGVITWGELKKIIEKRIAWNVTDYLSLIDHNKYFAQLNAEIENSVKNNQILSNNFTTNSDGQFELFE